MKNDDWNIVILISFGIFLGVLLGTLGLYLLGDVTIPDWWGNVIGSSVGVLGAFAAAKFSILWASAQNKIERREPYIEYQNHILRDLNKALRLGRAAAPEMSCLAENAFADTGGRNFLLINSAHDKMRSSYTCLCNVTRDIEYVLGDLRHIMRSEEVSAYDLASAKAERCTGIAHYAVNCLEFLNNPNNPSIRFTEENIQMVLADKPSEYCKIVEEIIEIIG